jgi:hypothetical protein
MSQADDPNTTMCIGFNPLAPIGEIAAQLRAERLRHINAGLVEALEAIDEIAKAAIAQARAAR